MKKLLLTTAAIGLVTTAAYAADPMPVIPADVPVFAPVEVEEAGGPAFTLSQFVGRDDGTWFSETAAEVAFKLSDAIGIALNGYGAVAFENPAEAELGIGAKIFVEFGNITVAAFTGVAWDVPGGDRSVHVGGEVEVEFDAVEISVEFARFWENGAPAAFELEIEGGLSLGERLTLLAGVGFEWEGGPPETTVGFGLEYQLSEHFALQARVERVIGDSWSFGGGFILTFGGGDD